MGEDVANTYAGLYHAHGTDPFEGEIDNSLDADEAGFHWGDKGIGPVVDAVDTAKKAALKSAALASQSAFNTEASSLSFYPSAWSGLTSTERTHCEALSRWAWAQT